MRYMLAKLGAVSFVAGAGLEFVLQVTGYNQILEDSAIRKRLEAELAEQEIENRMIQKYGKEKIEDMKQDSTRTNKGDTIP